MGNRGRFGKYGKVKRMTRLRKARAGPGIMTKKGIQTPRADTQFKDKAFSIDRITTRPANASDVDYIRTLSKRGFRRYGSYDNVLSRWFESGATVTLLAVMGKRPVGFAMLGRSAFKDFSFNVYELLAIAVEPEMQKRGIGDRLMRGILGKAKQLQVEILVLHTAKENVSGRKLFQNYGFVPSEIKKDFYPEGQDALMMYRDLS